MNQRQPGPPQPPRNVPLTDDEDGRIELEQYLWRERRARVNDEQALEDMTRGTPRDVPRATHLPIRHREPHSGETLLLVGLLIGSLIVIGVLLAGMPAHLPPTGCTP
jgi:hypothetical protein